MIFSNQVGLDPITAIADQGNFSAEDTWRGIDAELDANNPATVAGAAAAATALISEVDQFEFLSMDPSFDITADSGLGGDSVITDWDGMASDIVLDASVSVGGWTWDGATGIFTATNAVGDHVALIGFAVDAEKQAGGGVQWRFSIKIDGGTPINGAVTKDFDVLSDRVDDHVIFPLQHIPAAGTQVQFFVQPQAGGMSTLRIYKFIPRFLRHTN